MTELAANDVLLERLTAQDANREDELSSAHKIAQENAEDLARLVLRLGIVAEAEIAAALADITDADLVSEADLDLFDLDVDETLPRKFLIENRVLLCRDTAGQLTAVMAFPHDAFVIRALELALSEEFSKRTAVASSIDGLLNSLETDTRIAAVSTLGYDDDQDAATDRLRELASDAPVVTYVNGLIQRAAKSNASDIHLEPVGPRVRVRFRIDGVLREVSVDTSVPATAVVSRIKLVAGLDIAENRLPQDGRFGLHVDGTPIDLRVSTIPTIAGESVVLRLLEKERSQIDLSALGFSESIVTGIRAGLGANNGLFLVTGPTGSGKTTTLYGGLQEINSPERKIVTVEDPVEYEIQGVNQTQIKPSIGLNFADALRSLVRQDPDVIMVGEIRDTDTANIAIRSGLTGHLVLSTLHTNDAGSTPARLIDMGVEPYLVSTTVIAVLAQRLIRKLCLHCRQPELDSFENSLNRGDEPPGIERQIYAAVGCDVCLHTGYRGRIAVGELMVFSDEMRAMINNRCTGGELQQHAITHGMEDLRTNAQAFVRDGLTTISEVRRVLSAE